MDLGKLSLRYLFKFFSTFPPFSLFSPFFFFPPHQHQLHLPIMLRPGTLIRQKAYDGLSEILAKLGPPSPKSLSKDQLQLLGIECTVMALLPQRHRVAQPLFCKLVPSKVMDEAFDRTFVDEDTIPPWPEYLPTFSSRYYPALSIGLTLLDYTMSGQEIREPLLSNKWYSTGLVLAFFLANDTLTYRAHRDSTSALSHHQYFYPDTRDSWGVSAILRVDDISQPHLACLLMDEAPADEDLRPSELISAVRLMKQAIRLDRLDQFRVNPVRVCFSVSAITCWSDTDTMSFLQVYVYSFCSYQARILETYYEAGTFYIRKTPYVDFAGEEDKEKIKLYLRWMMSEPSGNTTVASAKDSDDGPGGKRETGSSATDSSVE